MTLNRKIDFIKFKFWELAYDVSYFVLGNLPYTYEVKHKMNMAYIRFHLHEDQK